MEPASTICIVENSILDTEKIIFGTADGRIVVVRKSSQDIGAIVCAFATQVTRIFRFPDSFENSSTLIIAVSLNNAVAVVDIEHGQLLHLIPGSNMNLKNISVAKDDHNKFCIEYYNNTRVWNLKSNCDVQGDLMSADKLYCKSLVASQGKRKSWGPLVPLASNLQRGASLVLMDLERLVKLASSQVALYSKDAQALLTCLSPLKGGLSSAHPSVRLSLAVREDQLTSVVTIASDSGTTYEEEAPLLIACIALETISDPRTDIHELIERYLSQYEFLEIDGFVKSALVFQNKFERIARLCLSSMAKRLVVKKQAAIDLANKWRPQLPSLCKDNINSEEGRQALLLIGALCIAENMLNLTNLNFVEKDVSESIQLCLIPDADNSMRELSISLLGSGWLVWQKWFNPIQILNSIIFILYNNGFTQKDSPKMSKILLICEECIKGISDSNMTLLISTLALQASDSNNPSDGRITALRLLSLLVSDNSGHHHALDKHYLPTVTSAAVKLLDPTDSVLREAAPIGGASLITEATRFLGTLVSKFPQDTSFHKSQQKLAITISREPENRSLDSPIIVLVYDLRSGGVSSTLGYRQSYDFISGLEFSINGKYLAAVIVDRKIAGKTAMHVSIVIWKLGYGITSIFQSLSISSSKESSPNVTNPSTPTEESTIQSGNIIYPKFIKEIQIDCKDSVKLQWTGDKIIEVLGDLDPQPTIINIEMN